MKKTNSDIEWLGQIVSKPKAPTREEVVVVDDEVDAQPSVQEQWNITDEVFIVGCIIIGLVVILFVLILVVCCRKSNSELMTVQLEKEVENEKR